MIDEKIVNLRSRQFDISENEAKEFIKFCKTFSNEDKIKIFISAFGKTVYSSKDYSYEQWDNPKTWGTGTNRLLLCVAFLRWQGYKKEQGLAFESSEKSEMRLNNIKKSYSRYI